MVIVIPRQSSYCCCNDWWLLLALDCHIIVVVVVVVAVLLGIWVFDIVFLGLGDVGFGVSYVWTLSQLFCIFLMDWEGCVGFEGVFLLISSILDILCVAFLDMAGLKHVCIQ